METTEQPLSTEKAHHKRRLRIAAVVGVLVLVGYFCYPFLLPDRVLMWETTSIDSGRASTHRAQAAAKRHFDRINLRGKTRSEIIAIVGDPQKSNDSIYNFPFYPVESEVMTYRFDTGNYGWQFNIRFGPDGRATNVEHKGIE